MIESEKNQTSNGNNEDINKENEVKNPFVANEEGKDENIVDENPEKTIEDEFEILKNQYLRLAADFDNYRKRQAQEREALLKYGAEDTLKKLLPILDTFERAQKSFSEMDDPEKIKESFDILRKQFVEALEKVGLQKIDTIGKEFDPNFHEAVMQTATNDHPDHSVLVELQSGYKLGERVIRPALVNVAVNQ
ncbi:MAG: nucleotide exchange factor GrpE [Candidatus Gastranaerophilales bacterium]|nr:nucleotide exchange factor GrpE [Candidatus Gastranaerophilales bacterium]